MVKEKITKDVYEWCNECRNKKDNRCLECLKVSLSDNKIKIPEPNLFLEKVEDKQTEEL